MNEDIPDLNVNGLCSYQANHCGPNKVVDLMRNHQSTFVESNGRWDNISDSTQTNERLLFQASLLDQVRDAVIAIDLHRRVIYWNRFAEVMYQWTAEEAVGKLVGDLIVPIHSREPRERIHKDLEHQGHWEGEFDVRRKDGTQFPVFTTNTVILDSHGRRIGFVEVSVDISERQRNEEEKRRLLQDLTIHQRQLEALSHRQVEIQEAEKRHIARELHDEIGQLLTGAKMKLEGVIQSSTARDSLRLQETEDLIDELISRVRALSLDLRPPILDSLGLLPAVKWHLRRVESQTDLSITFEHDQIEGKRFTTEIETAAFRTIQEALTNAIRYSKAANLRITVKAVNSNLMVEIQDDGLGFNPEIIAHAEKSIGLTGMRERAKLLGGALTIHTSPGKGVTVVAVLPLEES
jgi:PAS domain S-box-containing protein